MVSVFHVILNGMYNYNSYIVGWHGIRPGQGGLSLTILPPVVHPQKWKTKRAKLKLESKNKLTIFITCLFPISVPYNCICHFFFIFAHMFLSSSVLIFVHVLFSPDFPGLFYCASSCASPCSRAPMWLWFFFLICLFSFAWQPSSCSYMFYIKVVRRFLHWNIDLE